MPSRTVIIAVTLSILMVMTAGCTSWGTDGPANPDEETDGNGEAQTNESSGDGQETESDDSGTEEEQQDDEADSDKSSSTDSPEEPSSEGNTDETDATGPSETDDGGTVDSTEETDTTDETETDSPQANSDQGDQSPSSNGGGDNGDGSPAAGSNTENGEEEPSENDGSEDSDNSNENGDETPTNGDDNGANGNGDNGDNGENGEQVTCDAFDTQGEAQEYFDENPEERGHLDWNNDGVPCEDLPSAGNGDEEVYTLTVEAESPVTLERTWNDASTTQEPTDGSVEFSVIAGEYTLSAEGYEDEVVTVEDDQTVTMSPVEPEAYTLVVTFERMDNGDAVTGGVVIEDENGDQVAETHMDSPGENYNADENQYEFELPAGEYQVSGHMLGSMTMNVAPDENSRTITLDQDQTITFPVEYHPHEEEQDVTITVTDEENTPIEGASVEVDAETKETDEDGAVQFSLIDGEYSVSVSAEGYQDAVTTIEIDHENDTFSVTLKESNGNGGGPPSLVVSSIHADAAGDDHENLNDEYIELTNEGSSAVDMTGWTLSDEANHVYDFPSGFTLEPGDSVTVYTGSGSDSDSQLYWGSGSAVWNNAGDTIIVTNDTGETVIEREYS